MQRLTKTTTEADLEALTRGALAHAFPWIPAAAIKHQLKFSFQLGRKKIEVASVAAQPRLDILLEVDGAAFAVMELKRPGIALDDDDEAQGLSYAKLLNPPAPLVVVTNGEDVRVLETHTGQPWNPTLRDEASFRELLRAAARVAKGNLKHAISTLMGASPTVWVAAVRHVTADVMAELTATPRRPAAPFLANFRLPRKATREVRARVNRGEKLVAVVGPPLVGKSNVLRDLAVRMSHNDVTTVLFLEAGTGAGVYAALADALSRSLAWPVSSGEARAWLMRLAEQHTARLVIALDGLDATHTEALREVEELSSSTFGAGVSVVVAADESTWSEISTKPSRREDSAIGRRAVVVRVSDLDDQEFRAAVKVLNRRRIFVMRGAAMAPEYRRLWLLRAAISGPLEDLDERPDDGVMLGALMGLQVIHRARERFAAEPDVRRMFNQLARALVSDGQVQAPPELVFARIEHGLLRRAAVLREMDSADLRQLIDQGYVRPGMSELFGPTVHVRMPELLASETAYVLAQELSERVNGDLASAGEWIAGAASNLLLGDLVAAQALVDAMLRNPHFPAGLIDSLFRIPPERQQLSNGGRYAVMVPGVGTVDLSFDAQGNAQVILDGEIHDISIDAGERTTYANLHPWLVLSYLAGLPFESTNEHGETERGDASLLLALATSEAPLRAARGGDSQQQLPMFDFGDFSGLTPSAGILEPVTMGIADFFLRESEEYASTFVRSAVGERSAHLVLRVHTALAAIAEMGGHLRASWARRMIPDVHRRMNQLLTEQYGRGRK